MAFTADELANIAASALEKYLDKGTVFAQNVANKPMLAAFNQLAGKFNGGKETISWAVKAGQSGNGLTGYTGTDQVSYYNPVGTKRASAAWREHHIGITVTHTELKIDGIDLDDDDNTSAMEGREEHALANLLEEKLDTLGEDYADSLDKKLHGDGSDDAKALAGVGAIILDVPNAGTTFGLSRVTYPWWRNRAATADFGTAGGQGAITVNTANGGALLQFLEKEWLQLNKFARGGNNIKLFAGSDFIDGYQREIRANGMYSQSGFSGGKVDGSMGDVYFKSKPITYDPTLDALGQSKRMYAIDMGRRGVRLLYMDGQRYKKHKPARPVDRYVMYQGITMTGVVVAKQLNTSGVYDIA